MIERLLIRIMKPKNPTRRGADLIGIEVGVSYSITVNGLVAEKTMSSCFNEGSKITRKGRGHGKASGVNYEGCAGRVYRDPFPYFIADHRVGYHDVEALTSETLNDAIIGK